MRIRVVVAIIAIFSGLAFTSVLRAQSAQGLAGAKTGQSSGIPDLSGIWDPDFHGPEGIRLSSWDPSDPFAQHPEKAPMTPWAAEKFKGVRPPFGALQTMDNTNDPVQRFCDPPGIPRIYMYPWEITFIQAPKIVYILYEYTKVWRAVAMDRQHPKDPDNNWMGDAIGRYEGKDTLVIDTVGFNDKTWLDQTGHPHSDALHVIERFRRPDHERLELTVTIDDPKAYTKTFSASKVYKLTNAPMGETVCAYSEMKAFQDNVIDKTQTSTGK